MKRNFARQVTPCAAGRRSLGCLILLACALSGGCLAQPGDELIGRWEGRSEQQDAQAQAEADTGNGKKLGDKRPDDGEPVDGEPKVGEPTRGGKVVPTSTANAVDEPSGDSPVPRADDASVLETIRPTSLLDPFEFTIRLHFEDRQNVQMTFQAAERRESLRGTWSVVGRTGDALNLEIVPVQPNTETAASADSGKGTKPAARRFKIVFSPDDSDRFTMTEVDTGRQQGSIVFRRQKAE